MNTAVRDLIDRVLTAVDDPDADNWSAPEGIQYLNEALDAMVLLVPQQFTVIEPVQLVAGVKQTLPTLGVQFIRIVRAREVSLRALEQHYPAWPDEAAGTVREWARDTAEPTTFWVNPPQSAASPGAVDIEYVKRPEYVDVGDRLPTDPMYDAAIIEYILYRAYAKDTDYAGQDGRAQMHFMKWKEMTSGPVQQSG